MKKELGSPGEGNAWQHIVEQSQINNSGFSSTEVNNINNIISICEIICFMCPAACEKRGGHKYVIGFS